MFEDFFIFLGIVAVAVLAVVGLYATIAAATT